MTAHAPTPAAVRVIGLQKRFRLPHERVHTLKERVLHPLHRTTHDVLQALQDVSFSVAHGEFFGIVGRNGSGKSTLLKCMAGIYAADEGRIEVAGRLSTFIELGVGFNPDLAARDNVVLNATMLGLSPREARRRSDEVIAFAELEDFVDLKVKNYSSGMLVRLAFSTMIQVDADIMLIDEVLAVGDAAFQQKCFEEFERIRASGRTVLLVTHDMAAVQRFCTRAMLLEHGRVVEEGDPEQIGNRYLELNFSERARTEVAEGEAPRAPDEAPSLRERRARIGDGRAEIVDAWFLDERGERTEVLHTAYPCVFCGRVRFHEDVEAPALGFGLHNSRGTLVFNAATDADGPASSGTFNAGDLVEFRVHFGNILEPDRYEVTVSVRDPHGAWLDLRDRCTSIMIAGARTTGGLVQIPFDVGVHPIITVPGEGGS